MKNKDQHLTGIRQTITHKAFDRGPEDTAIAVTELLDKAYVLIERTPDMPEISHGTLDDAFGGLGHARTKNLTEKVFDGDFKKMRTLGLQYLVMADYVEAKVVKEQIDSAKLRRFKVFRELFPDHVGTLDQFSWDSLHKFEQTVIDKMVLMHIELDKNF